MAIAYDASASGTSSGANSLTFAHTCGGNNRILFVAVWSWEGTSDNITGVTYGGVAMAKIGSAQSVGGTTNPWSTLWYLAAPAMGANNVVVSRSNTTFQLDGASISYSGAAQSGIPDSTAQGSQTSGTSYTATTTVVNTGCWLVMMGVNDALQISAGTSTTLRQQPRTTEGFFDSNGTVATGAKSLIFTHSNGGHDGSIIASFKPALPTAGFFDLL